ncbi:2-succinyl-5-enolpyruvyl-6-hydroxy-3-cyclohexene-1-carboxylic-acid synthase [Bacillus marasmi]|uniref:2-succinyl-5-enolpyruvyl-6-hydroxy-3- cyclohexene-1-carboxylic-acid synthase n=1 Tax=Bacillus marasmi TaxID=1926279 RepID=UPI0011CBC852|nr:2-succinyl-5-enolpyruvyl-6-hydroxy-3-cyclohexene-1-carboxylic-acid synthase [Bacillus marasmi]
MNHQESLTAYLAAFVGELVQSGLTDVVVSPGSRSTPLALMMAEHPGLRVHIQIDERSAGFFALGIAKASHKSVALLCTSGTAAANYYPAVVEANISRVPLIVLTADRPHELRDVGAPQAINQIHLYGNHVKWFVEMALPEATNEMISYAQTVCARAIATSQMTPAGPVHLNFPFREPLIPQLDDPELFEKYRRVKGSIKIHGGQLTLPLGEFTRLAQTWSNSEKGIIVCGPIEDSSFQAALLDLAEKLQFPILADPLSQLRSGQHSKDLVIDTYDTFLRNQPAKDYVKPDIVIRFGAMPVSKALTIFLKENSEATHYVIDGGGGWRDPNAITSEMIYCDEALLCQAVLPHISARSQSSYLQRWTGLNTVTKQSLTIVNDETKLSEAKLFYRLAELLPENATVFVGNSMPIRDLDSFFHNNDKNIRVMANRGANGIDGIVSTALGAAFVHQPLYLILGDLTLFHDLNGLVASKMHSIPIDVVVINNNGGGIFSFLPQSNHPKHFELLFGTPVDLDFSHAVQLYGGEYTKVNDWEHLAQSLEKPAQNAGLNVHELVTERDTNLKEHRELWKSVSQEIEIWLKGAAQ